MQAFFIFGFATYLLPLRARFSKLPVEGQHHRRHSVPVNGGRGPNSSRPGLVVYRAGVEPLQVEHVA